FIQNILMDQKLTEYHTGYRAYSAEALNKINFELNSNDFIFDNEMIALLFYKGFSIAEITCPAKYFEEASSINFRRSLKYGLGVLRVSFLYFLTRTGIYKWKLLVK
ncbi:MAG: glycosyltransferase family 2 protein, partial [Bacteroidetes bacterium]